MLGNSLMITSKQIVIGHIFFNESYQGGFF